MTPNQQPRTLCIDIGGTGIKVLLVDARGEPLGERLREMTPEHATPAAGIEIAARLAQLAGEFDRVPVGFPGVIKNGLERTAPNLDGEWTGFNIDRTLERKLGNNPRTPGSPPTAAVPSRHKEPLRRTGIHLAV